MKSADRKSQLGTVRKGGAHLQGKPRLRQGTRVMVAPTLNLSDSKSLSRDQEARFWDEHDFTNFFARTEGVKVKIARSFAERVRSAGRKRTTQGRRVKRTLS
jgi:hypothetical protein